MSDSTELNYGYLMQKAMRGMMAEVLCRVADEGLPGDHHFYICFETGHPGVDIADWLRETYPEEMTIVLQEWFEDLAVTPDRFSVTLNFSDQPQTLVIPFAAVKTFIDPSVKFGLKFDAHDPDDDLASPVMPEEIDPDDAGSAVAALTEEVPDETTEDSTAEVVNLDQFRKH